MKPQESFVILGLNSYLKAEKKQMIYSYFTTLAYHQSVKYLDILLIAKDN